MACVVHGPPSAMADCKTEENVVPNVLSGAAPETTSSKAPLLGGGEERGRSVRRTPRRQKRDRVDKSPFFAPSTPRRLRPVSTPGGTVVRHESVVEKEHKSTVVGASSNLINAVLGAGIVGVPYAMRQCGLVAGVFMVAFSAILTEKSLRLLIETARHIDVPSYETLFEATFGTAGFIFISANMFIMAYGGMLSYLMIVKDTLPRLLGFAVDNYPMKRAVLTVSSLVVMLPLSMQRDMADLAKTSRISVVFYCSIVLVVSIFSPIAETVEEHGGYSAVLSNSIIHPSTFFAGVGVLSFAFVCQHSAFIIAGSLERPSKKRWGNVTALALVLCFVLATACGVTGFLGFLEETNGNILNNFGSNGGDSIALKRASNIARGMLCGSMFFVYPMESFVARHIFVVLLFQGRRAHEGEDHAVLARPDRRIALTLALYLLALVPALLFEDFGAVLAVTGAIGGSCLSYIGPGCTYLAAHGDEFLDFVRKRWGEKVAPKSEATQKKRPDAGKGGGQIKSVDDIESATTDRKEKAGSEDLPELGLLGKLLNPLMWYILLMPIWCSIASLGKRMVSAHEEKEALKSPHPNRLGNVIHNRIHRVKQDRGSPGVELRNKDGYDQDKPNFPRQSSMDNIRTNISIPRADSMSSADRMSRPAPHQIKLLPSSYGATGGAAGDQAIAAAIAARNKQSSAGKSPWEEGAEEDPQHDPPTILDFVIAIGYIIFGVIALSAGLLSIYTED